MECTFDYEGENYHATYTGSRLEILDCDGDLVFAMTVNDGMPTVRQLKKFLFIYNQGYLAGKDRGRRDCQYDIRMALGIKSDGSTM